MWLEAYRAGRVRAAARLILLCILVLAPAVPASAQFSLAGGAERLQAGQTTHLFASWSSQEAVHGVLVQLPPAWHLRRAVALRFGYEPVPIDVQPLVDGRVALTTARPIQGAYELVLRVETAPTPGAASWSLVPFVREEGGSERFVLEGYRITRRVELSLPAVAPGNRVLAFSRSGPPLLLRRSALPGLGRQDAYTVAFWLKTTGLGEVVLSTWDGDEDHAYPLEFVVDAGGRLVYYHGEPGAHHAMTSRRPVAEGNWHHVALTNDPESGWARLYLDGHPVDSLRSVAAAAADADGLLALGGRIPSTEASGAGGGAYSGELDEVDFLPSASSAAAVRGLMRSPLADTGEDPAGGRTHLGFEKELPSGMVARRSEGARRVASDLAFYEPVRELRAVAEPDGIHIGWRADEARVEVFVVERSTDGRHFEEVGRVDRAEAEEGGRYRYVDREGRGDVLFYRVVQRFGNGSERSSSTIKLGLGRGEDPATALIGNFPNPFNTATTITYEVHESQRVRLSVWDLAGQQVASLVDRVQPSGVYEVRYEARELPSGTYFARLQTATGTQIHKMILMK